MTIELDSNRNNFYIFNGPVAPSVFLDHMQIAIPWPVIIEKLPSKCVLITKKYFSGKMEFLFRIRLLELWFNVDVFEPNAEIVAHDLFKGFAGTNANLLDMYTHPAYLDFCEAMSSTYWTPQFLLALTQVWAPDAVGAMELESTAVRLAQQFSSEWARSELQARYPSKMRYLTQ